STRTITVLSCLSLTTMPCSIRFGISLSSLRLCRPALLSRDGLEPRDVAAHLAHPRRVLELAGGPLEAQVELLLLELDHLVVDLLDVHAAGFACFHGLILLGDALDEARLDRQLGGGEIERLARDLHRHAVDLEQDAARLDAAHPQFRRALALAHAHLDRLLRHRHVRENPDPDAAGAFHVAGPGGPRPPPPPPARPPPPPRPLTAPRARPRGA